MPPRIVITSEEQLNASRTINEVNLLLGNSANRHYDTLKYIGALLLMGFNFFMSSKLSDAENPLRKLFIVLFTYAMNFLVIKATSVADTAIQAIDRLEPTETKNLSSAAKLKKFFGSYTVSEKMTTLIVKREETPPEIINIQNQLKKAATAATNVVDTVADNLSQISEPQHFAHLRTRMNSKV